MARIVPGENPLGFRPGSGGTGIGRGFQIPKGVLHPISILKNIGFHIHNGLFGSKFQKQVVVDHAIKAQELNL